jgi:uncharacterized membrane protein
MSERDYRFDSRNLLAGATESATYSEAERESLREYKAYSDMLNKCYMRLDVVEAEIKENDFPKRYDKDKMESLIKEKNELTEKINALDETLLKLETSKTLKRVLQIEKERLQQKIDEDIKSKAECFNCKFYNNKCRDEMYRAVCSKHMTWVAGNETCENFEAKHESKPIEEPKEEPKAKESQIKVIIKHSIIFVVCFLAMALIYSWTSEKTWGWDWDCYPTKCFIGLFLFLIPAIIGIVCLVKISKILISSIISLYKTSIKYKERCYKKIDRLHSYLERGSITQEEFDKLKQSILDAMER